MTRAQTEIAVQSFLRIDHEFVAVKGRISGSQEAGRVFFVPYSEINYLGFMNAVTDNDFHELFDSLHMAPPAYLPADQYGYETCADSVPAASAEPQRQEPPQPSNGMDFGKTMMGQRPQTDIKIRSEILERFRAKSGARGGGPITHHKG